MLRSLGNDHSLLGDVRDTATRKASKQPGLSTFGKAGWLVGGHWAWACMNPCQSFQNQARV